MERYPSLPPALPPFLLLRKAEDEEPAEAGGDERKVLEAVGGDG